MRLQDYKKFITMAFVGNTRRGFADWRDCGSLCRDDFIFLFFITT